MLNPLMLLGLLGLAVPILIHLINRQRMRPRLLATLQFLDRQDVANAFAPVPRDVLQLLLRLLLLALFILLMARLTAPGPKVGPRAVAIVLDNSLSMRRLLPDGQTPLFEQHRARILELVRGLSEGDYFSFTLVGDQVFASTGFTRDRDVLERAVKAAWVSDGGGRNLYATIEDGLRELQSRRAPNTALLVFSDQQAQNYQAHLAAPGLAPLLRGSRTKLVFVQDALEVLPNVELGAAEFQPPTAYVGAGGKAAATLHNAADQEQTVTVSLKSGAEGAGSRSCKLASGETVQMELANVFGTPVDTGWSVSLSDDGFNADNEFYTTVRMRASRHVLLVAPDRPGAVGPGLFATAVNPAQALVGSASGGTHVNVERLRPTEFEPRKLAGASLVVLYGVAELGPDQVKELATFVSHGGGVYLVPDAKLDPTVFNAAYTPLLAGFRLGALQEPKSAVSLDRNEKNVADPLLLGLLRGEWGTVADLRVARYFATLDTGAAKPALKTSDGQVLLAVAVLGMGHVCVQTHSWEVSDTTLPRSLPFVAVVRAIVDRLSVADDAAGAEPDVIRAGDSHRLDLPMFRGLGGAVALEGPRKYAFDLSPEDGHATVKDVYAAGIYRAAHPKKPVARDRWLAVNRAPEESAAVFLSAEQLAGLGGLVKGSDQLAGLFLPRRELYALLLGLVFLALTAETLWGALRSRRRKEAHEPVV